MTVGELIKKLEEFDPESPVMVDCRLVFPIDVMRVSKYDYRGNKEGTELSFELIVIEV